MDRREPNETTPFHARVEVWARGNYAHSHMPTPIGLSLAETILNGTAMDISQGATHFYSPISMPNEGETPSSQADVRGGLESVAGVTRKAGKYEVSSKLGKTYSFIRIPGIQEKDFKFFRP